MVGVGPQRQRGEKKRKKEFYCFTALYLKKPVGKGRTVQHFLNKTV
jgi:hypothetical protein